MYYCHNSAATKRRYDRYTTWLGHVAIAHRCSLCRAQLELSSKLVDKRLEVVFRAHGQGRQADAKGRRELAAIT